MFDLKFSRLIDQGFMFCKEGNCLAYLPFSAGQPIARLVATGTIIWKSLQPFGSKVVWKVIVASLRHYSGIYLNSISSDASTDAAS